MKVYFVMLLGYCTRRPIRFRPPIAVRQKGLNVCVRELLVTKTMLLSKLPRTSRQDGMPYRVKAVAEGYEKSQSPADVSPKAKCGLLWTECLTSTSADVSRADGDGERAALIPAP